MAKIKVSDYIANFLVQNGIEHLFLISGGGMMHMLDSVAKQKDLNLIFNLNEQASGICAESYAQYTNQLGACLLTTGPGATNAITGCAGAWMDSTPTLYLSGQAKTADMGQLRGLRYFGAQEIGIIPVVKPITKYAEIILNKEEIRYHLEKAVYLAQHGRRGPVWLDVPLDVQGACVEEEQLRPFVPEAEQLEPIAPSYQKDIDKIYEILNKAERPVILMGHGVVAAGGSSSIRTIAEKLQVPIVATWRAKGIFGDDEKLFMGYPGIPAPRYSNYILQNSDFLLILGTRLNPALTAYQEEHFAPVAQKIIVDIEQEEINKLKIPFALKICGDAGIILNEMIQSISLAKQKDYSEWIGFCNQLKNKYPIRREVQPHENDEKVDGYYFAERLSHYSKKEDIFVGSSSGRTCGISHMAYSVKKGQKFISSMGIGSMGWCIPSALACAVAGKRRTLVMEGDGSLQSNLQELALVNTYHIPVKIFIWSNQGYASIYSMQKNNFTSNFAGCTPESGLVFPAVEDLAETYKIPYYCITRNEEVEDILRKIMEDDQPVLCEIVGSINFDEIPKSMTVAKSDGTFSSSSLEKLYPFLPEEEEKENIPYWR